ncbi:hypothetical protein Tco_0232240 [Tanacetum coccineum]
MTHPHLKRSFVPQAVLTRIGKINIAGVNVNTAGASINTVIRPINTAASNPNINHPRPKSNAYKRGYSQSSRPFNTYYANKNSIINTNVNTARVKNTTARDRVVDNPQQKYIEIRHHFIRDSYEKKLIQVIKIHTDQNVADLLIKAFDASRQKCMKNKRGWDTKIPQSGGPPTKIGDESVHKEFGDKIERAASTASSLEAKQDSGYDGNASWNSIGVDTASHIKYALTENPTIYVSLIHQFWETASTSTSENGEMEITATIDGRIKTVTEASIRSHLKLEDSDGIPTLPNAEFFKQLALIGPKKTAWEQFSSNIATAIICLATNKTFNFSKMIFDDMMKNLDKEPTPLPHDSSHPRVQSLGSDEGSLTLNELMVICTLLSKKVEDLQSDLKQTKLTYGVAYTKLVMKMKKLEKIVKQSKAKRRTKIVVSDDEEVSKDPSKQGRIIGRTSADTKILLELEEPTELVEDPGSGEKGEKEISTANVLVSTASGIPEIDIARQEQEKYDLAQALELQKELDKRKEAEVRKNMCMYFKNQGGYKQSHLKGMSYDDVRLIFERVWDQNHAFVPKDSEIEKQYKEKLARKRASEKQSEEGAKRQKMEDDTEKEELKAYLDIVPREEFAMDVESLSTKYPIVDWKTHILTENFTYYQIIKADGSSKNYKIFSKMIDDFDRQDVIDLHRLVKERYVTTSPEGYNLMLWGDLKTLFEPDEEDKVWRNQHGYNLIRWRLIDSCGIHILLMDNGITIHMMVEKKYPLIQEMLSKMLNRRLEIDHESEMLSKMFGRILSDRINSRNLMIWR